MGALTRIATACVAASGLFAPAEAAAAFVHVVTPGESLSSIAATDGLTVEQLAAANGLPPSTELVAGSQVQIPPQAEGQAEAEGQAQVASPAAEAAATPASAEGAAEPASAEGTEGDGTEGDGGADDSSAPQESGTAAEGSAAAESQPVGEAAEGTSGGPPYPTQQTVSPEEVSSIAAANGVPSSLASAIADQESGFNNELVSSADARGVMQITPGTWSWINESLAGQAPLDPSSAQENVRGGVLLLHSLLESTGGNEALAAAGYYQGLPSVLAEGEYPSTQQYVENVQSLQQSFGGE